MLNFFYNYLNPFFLTATEGNFTNGLSSSMNVNNSAYFASTLKGTTSLFLGLLTAAGVVTMFLGIYKLIIAMAGTDGQGKIRAVSTIALAVLLISAGDQNTIELIKSVADPNNSNYLINKNPAQAAKVSWIGMRVLLNFIVTPLKYAGLILGVIAAFQLVLSIVNERPEEKIESGKLMMIGLILTSFSTIVNGLTDSQIWLKLIGHNAQPGKYVAAAVLLYVMKPLMIIPGAFFLVYGSLKFAIALRSEDANDKLPAAKFAIMGFLLLLVGIGLENFIS